MREREWAREGDGGHTRSLGCCHQDPSAPTLTYAAWCPFISFHDITGIAIVGIDFHRSTAEGIKSSGEFDFLNEESFRLGKGRYLRLAAGTAFLLSLTVALGGSSACL